MDMVTEETCTSGCRTKDHASYAECLRSKNAAPAGINVSASVSTGKLWETEIREYRSARAQGIQPKSTQLKDIRGAVARSNQLGKPVQET